MRRDDGDGGEEMTHPLSLPATSGNGIMKVHVCVVCVCAWMCACVCINTCVLILLSCVCCTLSNNSPDSFPFSDGDRQGMKLLSRIPPFSYTNATVFDIMTRVHATVV